MHFLPDQSILKARARPGHERGCQATSPPAPAASSGIDLAAMDKSVTPGDDFNGYASGGWLKATPIPPDKASYGIFAILADKTRTQTVSLIQDSAKAGSNSSEE